MSKASPAPKNLPDDRLWTKAEVAGYLCFTKANIDKLCRTRQLPFIQFPGCRRFAPDCVKAFLNSRTFGALTNDAKASTIAATQQGA